MSKPLFLELKVYKVAERLSDAVALAVSKWESFSRQTVGERMVRAIDGIGAGIATGHARRMGKADRRAIKASLYESVYWLRRASRRKLLTPAQIEQIQPVLDELGGRVRSYLRKLAQREKGQTPMSETQDDG